MSPLLDRFLGQLLAMLRPYISARMIDGPNWEHLFDRALIIPSSMVGQKNSGILYL